jgi:hypothetical protein
VYTSCSALAIELGLTVHTATTTCRITLTFDVRLDCMLHTAFAGGWAASDGAHHVARVLGGVATVGTMGDGGMRRGSTLAVSGTYSV